MNLKIRGISYHFERHQDLEHLPTLVLLHGFLGSGTTFQPILAPLKTFCNPVTIDLLGHGQTEGAELHYRFSAKEQVADLFKLLKEQFHAPLFLYGYSMGGRLALQLCFHHPHLVQGLILESSTFGIEHSAERQARQALDASRADQIMGNFSGFLDEWEKMPLFSGINPDSERLSKIQRSQNPVWMANSLLGFGTGTMPCLREHLVELRAPVQLIVGNQDSKFVHINQNMKKEIPSCELAIIQNAKHRVHSDQPTALTEILQSFINTNPL